MIVRLLIVLIGLPTICYGQYDNGIVGDPELDCADNYFEVRFNTRNPFRGLVFVKDHLEDPRCRSPPADSNGLRNTTLRLSFKDCSTDRRISSSPRGFFVSTTVVVAFHPDFLTKVDLIYKIQCFYMEMERVLEKEITINMPPPTLHTKQIPMPVCKYEVLDGSPTGPPVYYATVGQMVYHKWTCEAEQENTFCMTVHSCYVDDGNGERVQLINEAGCALDKYLLTNLEYPSDLMAGREAHVYKYADRDNMYFDCQITIRIKEPGAEYCDVPSCPDPPRRRRSQNNQSTEEVPEVEEKKTKTSEFIIPIEDIERLGWFARNFLVKQLEMCMSTLGFSALLLFNISFIALAVFVILYAFLTPNHKKFRSRH